MFILKINYGFIMIVSDASLKKNEGHISSLFFIPYHWLGRKIINFKGKKKSLKKEVEEKEVIFSAPGSQKENFGFVDPKKVSKIFDKVTRSNKKELVRFDKESLQIGDRGQYYVDKGTCTAMSFVFAKKYLMACRSFNAKFREDYIGIIERISPEFEQSNELFRSLQIVFNTIKLAENTNPLSDEFKLQKIAAMGSYFDFSINEGVGFSLAVPLPHVIDLLEEIIKNLEDGVYLVRQIAPEQNEKGELHGHTTLFIKERDIQLFYDPNQGIVELESGKEVTKLYLKLCHINQQYDVKDVSIYRLDLGE